MHPFARLERRANPASHLVRRPAVADRRDGHRPALVLFDQLEARRDLGGTPADRNPERQHRPEQETAMFQRALRHEPGGSRQQAQRPRGVIGTATRKRLAPGRAVEREAADYRNRTHKVTVSARRSTQAIDELGSRSRARTLSSALKAKARANDGSEAPKPQPAVCRWPN